MGDYILVDRSDEIRIFQEIMERKANERIMFISGVAKRGKSRLLREYKRIGATGYSACSALVDLRAHLQTFDDILFAITQQIGGDYFPFYNGIREEMDRHSQMNVSRVTQFFSIMSLQNKNDNPIKEDYQKRRLSTAFVKDLRNFPKNSPFLFLFDTAEPSDNKTTEWLLNHFLLDFTSLPNTYIIVAGRELEAHHVTIQDLCIEQKLSSVGIDDHRSFCEHLNIAIDDETLIAFHTVFEGKPGLFVEYIPRLGAH